MKTLALAYTQGNYNVVIDRICAERGQLSDDQSSWIDKHSGYIIKNVEYSSDEGYDDTGFKSISRGVLERDMAEDIYEITETTNVVTKEDSNTKMVKNVLKTMVSEIGITLDETKIVMDVISAINRTIPVDEQSKMRKNSSNFIILLYRLFIYINSNINPVNKNTKNISNMCKVVFWLSFRRRCRFNRFRIYVLCSNRTKIKYKPWYVLKRKDYAKTISPKNKNNN